MTSIVGSTPKQAARGGKGAVPPEWLAERVVKGVGRVPAALGRGLDRLAKVPVAGVAVRAFSTVVFGLVVLGLIGLYIAIGSGFADLRASLEMTDLQFFDAWPMRVLLALLVIDLSVVTLRRIPLTLFKLGSWTVHIGILTLIGGSVWYFSRKQEGSVRIYQGQSVGACYDVTERALYAFRMDDKGNFDQEHPAITAIPSLPIYYEHLAQTGNPLDERLPGVFTGIDPALQDVNVRITGYYPSAVMQTVGWRSAKPGETGNGPGVGIQLGNGAGMLPESWLVGGSPVGRLLEGELPFGVEYLYHPTAERLRDLQASFDGPMGVTVRVPALKIERTYAVKPGMPIAVEGTPYTIEAKDMQRMPMASKGYKGASSTALTVGVTRKEADGSTFEFTRMALFRYPERSPDFVMENGKNTRKQDGVDPNVQIIFHDASVPQVWVVEEPGEKFSVIYRDDNGKSATVALDDKAVGIPFARIPAMKLQLVEHAPESVAVYEPFIIPKEQRPRSQTAMEVMQLSMLELEISGGTAGTAWKQEHVYVPFSPYAAIGDPPGGEKPAVVKVPGAGKIGLLLATVKRDMPSVVTLAAFEAVHPPGATREYQDFVSTLAVKDKQTGEEQTLVARLNKPAMDHGLYYFQSAWDGNDHAPPEERYTVLGVANRPGVWLMTIGAILIVAGIGYAFYVKPILLKYKKESVIAWNATRLSA